MACCAIGPGCGRRDLDEPAPGLELWNGKYSCTLCVVNPTKFAQPNFKKKNKKPQVAEPMPLAAPAKKIQEHDLFGEVE